MIVLDASAAVDLLLQRGPHAQVATLLTDHDAVSSELLVPDVLHALRRYEHRGELSGPRAAAALDDLVDLPVDLYPVGPMARPIWELCGDITPYDATYVVLAQHTGGDLVTADRRLARTAKRHCSVAAL
ncbi:type II toxin-antitoxin system VapC family toxin [Ornithinimicrobium sp. F0845]|uniref:type II toxin-antitoxin system VapC family toxin n=1 Tax=Ornithinimicrobium sp. F0845 TaxID=2926412 RepID=UPI001FF30C02|nr:type II toxin-antitoxin system VapC family toxin [Ornithinimicrobium sp. F0845]